MPGSERARERMYRIAVGGLLVFYLAMGIWFMRRNSATYDEPFGYYAGWAHLERGDFSVSPEYPPLPRDMSALPVYALSRLHLISAPRFASDSAPLSDPVQLFLARLPMLLLGLGTVVVVGRWAGRLWGTPAAIVATGFAVTEPTLIAHSGLVKDDIAVTFFCISCFYLVWLYLEHCSPLAFVLAGVALGCALASKTSAVTAVVALAVVASIDASTRAWVVPWRRRRSSDERWHPLLEAALVLGSLCALATIALLAVYRVHGARFWLDGLRYLMKVNARGQPAFLCGRYSDQGWWYYFPVAFALKTPVLTLAAIGAALAFLRRGLPLRGREALFLGIPVVVVVGAMMWSRFDVGVRYILPVYPFVLILASRVATFRPQPFVAAVMAVVIGWNAASVIRLAPHFLAAGNAIAGGPVGVARCLSDSNVDWGQALGELKRYMDRERIPALYLSYFGTARPSDYGIRYQYIPSFSGEDPGHVLSPSDKPILAISVTNLHGVYLADHDLYAWLRAKTPIATVGYAIYVYDLSDDPEAHCRLADAYARYAEARYQAIERAKCARSGRQTSRPHDEWPHLTNMLVKAYSRRP